MKPDEEMIAEQAKELTSIIARPDVAMLRSRLSLIAEEFFELIHAAMRTSEEYDKSRQCVYDTIDDTPLDVNLPEFYGAMLNLACAVMGNRAEFGLSLPMPQRLILEAMAERWKCTLTDAMVRCIEIAGRT